MQDVLKALIAKTELSMTEILGGTIASVVYAILILIAILIAYRISKKLIVGAIRPDGNQLCCLRRHEIYLG